MHHFEYIYIYIYMHTQEIYRTYNLGCSQKIHLRGDELRTKVLASQSALNERIVSP